MMNKYDTRPFFVRALKKELAKLGHGAQAQLARYSGVSKSLLSDILGGRTFGAEEKRRAIAAALGYEDYESFLDIGRKLMKVPAVRQASKPGRKAAASDELIELLRENRGLRQEIDALKAELASLKAELASQGREQACDPSVQAIRPARDAPESIGG